jgi:hypothetical protein
MSKKPAAAPPRPEPREVVITLRVGRGLKAKIEAAALAERRSVSQWLALAAEEKLAR